MNNQEVSTPPKFNPTEELLRLRSVCNDLTTGLNIAFDALSKLAGGTPQLHALLKGETITAEDALSNSNQCPT